MMNTRYMMRQKMMLRIAQLSRKYPYAGQKKSGYSGQMLLSSFVFA